MAENPATWGPAEQIVHDQLERPRGDYGLTLERCITDALRAAGLLAEDARFSMPPLPAWFRGRDDVTRFMAERMWATPWRLTPVRANGQLAFGAYLHAPRPGDEQANGLLVLTLSGDRIQAMTRFTAGVLPQFGLPPA